MDENGWFVSFVMYSEMFISAIYRVANRFHFVLKFIVAATLFGVCYPASVAGGQHSNLLAAISLGAMLYASALVVRAFVAFFASYRTDMREETPDLLSTQRSWYDEVELQN